MSFWRAIKQAVVGSISISPESEYVDGYAWNAATQVISSSAWSHRTSDVPFWITVNNGSGTSGQYFSFDYTENNSGSTRIANIRIWLDSNNSVYKTYTFEQTAI